jgi:hypothetical protein
LNYSDLPPDGSYGEFPDGQLFTRQTFYRATPGMNNDATSAPLMVRVNEWMAWNTHGLQNIDNASRYDDWVELYNLADTPAALGGCYLTDTLTDPFQFRIPAGVVVQPRGFLLVWADNQPGLNRDGAAALHVNFQLSKDGEAIGLFAADGTAIDTVTFGAQTNDVSQGRYPDGAASRYLMATPTPGQPNVVAEPPSSPRLEGVVLVGQNALQFSVTIPSGVLYQVQFTEDLGSMQWLPLGDPQTGTGAGVLITDDFGQKTQRFYRVILWP